MRNSIGLLVIAMLCGACVNDADDCRNTLTCPPLPEPVVIYVESDAGPTCDGQCVPVAQPDWQGPWLVWLGYDASLAPSCPQHASTGSDDYAPPAAPACTACECNPPTGSCTLPATASANYADCPATDPGTVQTSFDPPSGWDGSCTAHDAIAANLDCKSSPCIQSVTIGPLTLNESGCIPKPPVVPHDNEKGLTLARKCAGMTRGYCMDPNHICAPAQPNMKAEQPGFWSYCVTQHGANDPYTMTCPPKYPKRHVFSVDYQDHRTCTPCTCGAPEGSTCSTLVSVYEDDSCSFDAEIGSITVSAAEPACLNLPPGEALGSKDAKPPTYTPGSCQASGGEPTGDVETIGPITFCCKE